MKFKRIGTKMLACLLPIIILSMAVLTTISAVNSKKIIEQEISNYMNSELKAQFLFLKAQADQKLIKFAGSVPE